MDCPVCKFKKTRMIFKKYPGYLEGTTFKIYECTNCDIQFISTKELDNKIYDQIYSNKNTPGYDRYLNYARNVKIHKNPLKYLSEQEESYFPCFQFIKNKSKLEILEVGCGYGYLTYALNKANHNVIGIDISREAINYAKSHFGNTFLQTNLKNYKPKRKFDLIIATELIEHLSDPTKFISLCLNLLKIDGKILLTTPNKNYYGKRAIWKTDLPPIHTIWLSKNSFRYIAQKYNANYKFKINTQYTNKYQNKLVDLLLSKFNNSPRSTLNKSGKPYTDKLIKKVTFKRIIRNLILSAPIRCPSNYILNLFNAESQVLTVIIIKK